MKRFVVAAACLALAGCALFAPRAALKGVQVEIEGHRKFSTGELVEAMQNDLVPPKGGVVSKSAVDDAAYDVETLYLDAGFPDAKVGYDYVERPGGVPFVRFRVEEGTHARLGRIRFEGNAHASNETLTRFLEPDGRDDYVAASVRRAAVQIEDWYRSRGFVEAVVDPPRVERTADGRRADVALVIHEGVEHRITSVKIVAADGAPPLDEGALRESLARFTGEPYSIEAAQRVRGTIEDQYADRGYPDVKAEIVSRDVQSGSVGLVVRVDPGPRVRIGRVIVTGTDSTRPRFVERHVELEKGQWYSRAKERESFAQLFRSGIFDRVRITTRPAEGEPHAGEVVRDVVVELEESPARELWIEPGYGSYERLRVVAGYREKNLFGSGRILDTTGALAELAQSGSISLIDPWILGPDTTANATVFGNRRFEPTFERLETGVELGALRHFTRDLEVGLAYQYRRTRALDVESGVANVDPAVDVSEITLRGAFDTRDSFADPRKGGLSKASFELASAALGSELEFVRLRGQHAQFFPLGPRTVLGASLETGVIAPIGATSEIPIQERFFNGGESSVRSFREGQLGPKDDNGNPLGGETFVTASIELRQRLERRLEAALFFDAGNVREDHQDLFELVNYRSGVGIGLRYVLPVGPIRLDGALNPDPHGDESRGAIHLSVGFSF